MHAVAVALLRRVMSLLGARSSTALARFIVLASRLHLWLYRTSRGMLGRRFGLRHARFGMLTTTGRRTGLPRTVPLLMLDEDGDFVVVGSNGGLERPPAWVVNLQAHDAARLETQGRRYAVRAQVVEGQDHERLWARFVDAFRGYEDYRARTDRAFPIVLLRRTP